MPGTAFDVVVADYFLGAVERHWAHGASAMLERLLRAVKPGGYLLLVGLEPYESVLDRSSNDHDRLILDVEAIGDSAATIAGEKTYREIPEEWVKHQVNISRCDLGNFQVVATRHFPMRLTTTHSSTTSCLVQLPETLSQSQIIYGAIQKTQQVTLTT